MTRSDLGCLFSENKSHKYCENVMITGNLQDVDSKLF